MLFAGLQGQTVGLVATCVDRDTDDTAWHGALQLVGRRHIGSVRAAIAHGHTEPLGRANCDVGPHLARRLQKRQSQNVGGDNGNCFVFVQGFDFLGEVTHVTFGARILEDRTEHGASVQRIGIGHLYVDAQRLGAGFNHGDGLRVTVLVHKERSVVSFRARAAMRHGHGFSSGRGFVQQRCVCHFQTGHVRDHGLIVQKGFQTALRNLGLIGRVGRVPCRVFQNVAQDGRRRRGAIVSLPDQRGQNLVLRGHLFHVEKRIALGHGRAPVQRLFLTDCGRNRCVDQFIKRLEADHFQHIAHLGRRRADMAAVGEVIGFVVGQFEGHALILVMGGR